MSTTITQPAVNADAPPPTTTTRRRGSSVLLRRALYSGSAIALFLVIWEIWARLYDKPLLLPRFTLVMQELVESWRDLLPYAWLTLTEALLGFALAVLIGMPLGVLIVFSRRARDTIYPLLVASQMVPKIALAPILIVWFSLGLQGKVAVAFLIAFFPIVVSTSLGMEAVDRDMVRLFRSMRSGRIRTFIKLRLPVAAPSVFAGFRLAMTHAVTGAIVGEFIAANEGLGYYILFQNGQLNTPAVFAGVIVIAVLGMVLYFALELVEMLVSPHRKGRRRSGQALGTGTL